ncbi:MAG: DUF3857 domain-containing protein [Sphingobacteriales bacterium]
MKLLISILLFFSSSVVASAQNNYNAGLIPKELLPYASAVVRNEQITTTVNDLDDVTTHVKRVITILNQNGDDAARLYVVYDKITKVKSIRGLIYDEFGKVQQKISESDFEDEAVSDGFSLFLDDRAKVYKKAVTQYPYTIEFEYETRTRQSFRFDDWLPNPEPGLAVEKSSYSFICKPDYTVRYKEIDLHAQAYTNPLPKGMKIYSWEVNNMKARRYEPMSPGWENVAGRLMIAPEKFAYQDLSGAFSNWDQLGKWEYDKLIADREEVPAETAQHIKDLVAGVTDPKQKAKLIYEYMQQKTHYISVQVGIGGFRPFAAADVDKDGYGDCKALVNYTKSLLKVAGIDSWYCEVYAGRDEKRSLTPDFASVQGNHIILCLPFKSDTTWLECTSQKIPFGFLGDFTDDRNVLACTAQGGKLLHTPKYTTEENLQQRKADFVISDSGDLSGSMQTVFKGTDYEDRSPIIERAQAERLKAIRRYYLINNLDVKVLEYKQDKSLKPVTYENMRFSAKEYGAINDGKFYFSLNSVDRYSSGVKPVRNRINPVTIERGYTEEDNITYTLPKGYSLDSDPLEVKIDKPFGTYTATMAVKGDQLVYSRKFQVKDGTYSKDMYQDVVDFYQSVVDADNYNVVLVKK